MRKGTFEHRLVMLMDSKRLWMYNACLIRYGLSLIKFKGLFYHVAFYCQGSKEIPQTYFPIDSSAFSFQQEYFYGVI